MICKKCGISLMENVRFCPNCGEPCNMTFEEKTDAQILQQVPANDPAYGQTAPPNNPVYGQATPTNNQAYGYQQNGGYARSVHPYHTLGGFLKFLVVMYSWVGPILNGLVAAFSVIGMMRYMSYGLSGLWWIKNLIQLGLYIVSIWLLRRIGTQIKNREPEFLNSYQIFTIVVLSGTLLAGLLGGNIASVLGSLIGTAIGYAVWNIYFVKSVRVRTYMGSDEYLRRSMCNKNTPSPRPADEGAYM